MVLKEMYNLENRTQSFLKTIILAVYFDTSFISQVLKVERLFLWRESDEALVLSLTPKCPRGSPLTSIMVWR